MKYYEDSFFIWKEIVLANLTMQASLFPCFLSERKTRVSQLIIITKKKKRDYILKKRREGLVDLFTKFKINE